MFDALKKEMMNRISLLALIGVLVASLTVNTVQAQKNVEEAKAAINATHAEFMKAFNADDAIKAAYYYSNTALLMVPNQQKLAGRNAIKEYYKTYAQVYNDYFCTTNTLNVLDKMAYETGSYVVTVQIPGAAETYVDRGKYLIVWQKGEDGKWKIMYDVYNTDLAPSK